MKRRLLEEWLATRTAVASTRSSQYMRVHLLDEQSGGCAICGSPSEWSGQALAFVLDHIDGDSANHHRENPRLVCPNCDSQLPTYKNRNHGRTGEGPLRPPRALRQRSVVLTGSGSAIGWTTVARV